MNIKKIAVLLWFVLICVFKSHGFEPGKVKVISHLENISWCGGSANYEVFSGGGGTIPIVGGEFAPKADIKGKANNIYREKNPLLFHFKKNEVSYEKAFVT